jgi:hypothetical protein
LSSSKIVDYLAATHLKFDAKTEARALASGAWGWCFRLDKIGTGWVLPSLRGFKRSRNRQKNANAARY